MRSRKYLFSDSATKRQCLRQAENLIKADTPAIPSVKSRMNYISNESCGKIYI